MENNLNQENYQDIQTTADDDFFFEELQEESSQTEEAESENVETTQEVEQTNEPFMNIVYNGAEEALTREQAIELAQKGRNYDKLQARLHSLENSPELTQLRSMADAQGIPVNEFLNRLNSYQQSSDIRRIATELKKQYPDANDELLVSFAQEVYKNEQTNRQNQLEKEYENQRQQEQDAYQENLRQEIAYMQANYPKVDLNNLPQEVISLMQSGVGLVQSYLSYENKMLRERQKTFELNQLNARKDTGNITSNLEGQKVNDPFLQGFFGK